MNSGTPEETDTAARPWTDVSLYASWSDGFRREAQKPRFREAWSPLPDAEELYLVSCYVDTFTVSLLPENLHRSLTQLSRPLGLLLGRFSIKVLGTRWMPRSWYADFCASWNELRKERKFADPTAAVHQHLEALKQDLQRHGSLRKELTKALELNPPGRWDMKAAKRLLDLKPDQNPKKMSESLRTLIVDKVMEEVCDTVTKRLRPEFPLAQLKTVGVCPRLRSSAFAQVDEADALEFIARCTIEAIEPVIRSEVVVPRRAGNRSFVPAILSDRFRSRYKLSHEEESDSKEVAAFRQGANLAYEAARGWLMTASQSDKDLGAEFAKAWTNFRHWFDLEQKPIHWARERRLQMSRDEVPPEQELFMFSFQ